MNKSTRSYKERIKRCSRYIYLRIMRIRATPKQISRGLALGIFIGCLPIIPFQTAVIIPLAIILRASKLAGFIGSFISNPLNLIPFYMLLWYIGNSFFPTSQTILFDKEHLTLLKIIQQGGTIFLRMCLGGIILGTPLSLLVYYISLPIIRKYQESRAMLLLQNARERKRREELVDELEHIPISDDDNSTTS